MTLTEAILKKLTKEEIIELTFDYQDNFNQNLKSIKKGLSDLRENFDKLEAKMLSPGKSAVLWMSKWFRSKETRVMSTTPDMNAERY